MELYLSNKAMCTLLRTRYSVVTTCLDAFYMQNDVTIRLSRSIDRKYKRANNERPQRSASKTRTFAPHDN